MWWLVIVVLVFIMYLNKRANRKITLGNEDDTASSTIGSDVIIDDVESYNKAEISFEEQKKNREMSARNNYTKRKSLWGSNTEKSIYKTIKDINNEVLLVLPHVSLNEIFEAKSDKKYEKSRRKYIKYYHVDFLICEKEHLTPLLGIEVDGKYHNDANQQLSDAFKNELFKHNNIPLLRINCSDYNLEQVIRDIKNILYKAPVYCGKCGAEMVLKKGIDGKDDFYGCSCYKATKCTYKRPKDFKYVS
nr:DUF2726 domain-containing protein [uncultured Cellulosilyticum sp.]